MSVSPPASDQPSTSADSPPARGVGWWIAALILILLPPVASVGLIASRQMSYTDVFPFWSDEIYYWHQAATFARVSFDGGYYTVGAGEKIAPAEFTHFNFWGVVLPVFYGSIGKVVGWSWWSIPVINIVMMSLALLLWVLLVRPGPRQMALAGVLLFTFSPFLTYIPVSMSEVLQMALGIVLAAGFYRLWQHRAQSIGWTLTVIVFAVLAAGLRPAWAVLLPAVGFMGLRGRGRGWALAGVIVGLVLAGAMYKFFIWTSAPYPGNLEALALLGSDPARALSMLADQVSGKIQALQHGSVLEMTLRVQIIGVWVAVLLAALGQRLRPQSTLAAYDRWDLLLYTAIFLGIFILLILFYKVGDTHDYRFFAPFVLLGGFLMIARQHWLPLIVLIGLSLTVLFSAVFAFGQRATDYRAQQPEIVPAMREWEQILKEEIQYDPSAPSPWCNTVTYTTDFLLPPYLPVLLDPGIGLSLMFDLPDEPLKAQYLLLHDDFFELYKSRLSVELIMTVPNGSLYRNLNAVC